jgi:hypothetical protein
VEIDSTPLGMLRVTKRIRSVTATFVYSGLLVGFQVRIRGGFFMKFLASILKRDMPPCHRIFVS